MKKVLLALSFAAASIFAISCSSDDDVTTDSSTSDTTTTTSGATTGGTTTGGTTSGGTTTGGNTNSYAQIARTECKNEPESSEDHVSDEVCDCIYDLMVENNINSEAAAETKVDVLIGGLFSCALSDLDFSDLDFGM